MRILYVTRHFNHSGHIILERLIKENFDIVGILLHKDDDPLRKPMFRLFSKIKYNLESVYLGFEKLKNFRSEESLAKKNKLNIIYANSINSDEFYDDLKDLNPDIIVLGGGWHELLSKRVFDYPKLGCINTHPSLLPEFRGTSITRWQVKHGIKKSGSTIHYVNDRFDTGGMLSQKELPLGDYHSIPPQTLFKKLGYTGADIMVPLLQKIEKEGILESKRVEHNSEYYKYFKKWLWDKDKLIIDWSLSLREIHYFVLSCAQEHYKYLGPIFYISGEKYFLRKTNLVINNRENIESDDMQFIKLTNGNIGLVRNNESHILEIIQIQKYPHKKRNYRAINPKKRLHEFVNKKFTNG